MKDFRGKVAVVTGGASGIGLGLARVLLAAGARVVVADVEEGALETSLEELGRGSGEVRGIVTDVSSPDSVRALAEDVFASHGACHLLFNNAGVGSPSVNIWETTVNDWKWTLGVNVMGVVHGILAFVPRMIESGEEGWIVNTSSGNGGFGPLPDASVYAASKSAVSMLSECLAANLASAGTKLGASVFYPSGGMLLTGIWTCDRNRPEELAREVPYEGEIPSPEKFMEAAKAAGREMPVQDLDELAEFVLDEIRAERFVIGKGLEQSEATLHERASRIGKALNPVGARPGMG